MTGIIIASISVFVNMFLRFPAILPLMNIDRWLLDTTNKFRTAGIATARLDALVLLEDATGKGRAWLLAHPETPLQGQTLQKLGGWVKRRAAHEPLAYIRGKSEFYGREFLVSPATLQPRPETETMIDLLTSRDPHEGSVMADIGTGSGAIAITAKLELPHLIVHGTEIQVGALAIAHKNKEKLGAQVNFHEGNLLEPLMNTKVDIILANLPYVPDSHTINEAAMQEPAVAIFGGADGLDLYRGMFKQVADLRQQPDYILTESLPFQHEGLSDIARTFGYRLQTARDFIQLFKL